METVCPFQLPDFEDEWINQMEDNRSCERKSARDKHHERTKDTKDDFRSQSQA